MKLKSIALQAPDLNEPATLMQAFSKRRTNRDFDSRPVTEKHLSELLWAAYGANRPDGHKTVPSAMGIYPLDIYAVTTQGVYRYEPSTNSLEPVSEGDYRADTGIQDFAGQAPLDLVIVYNEDDFDVPDKPTAKMIQKNQVRLTALDAGAVTQNIYLYCAVQGLNVVERMSAADDAIKKPLGLKRHQHFVVAMSIGYPPQH